MGLKRILAAGLRVCGEIASAELVCPDITLTWDMRSDDRPVMLVGPYGHKLYEYLQRPKW